MTGWWNILSKERMARVSCDRRSHCGVMWRKQECIKICIRPNNYMSYGKIINFCHKDLVIIVMKLWKLIYTEYLNTITLTALLFCAFSIKLLQTLMKISCRWWPMSADIHFFSLNYNWSLMRIQYFTRSLPWVLCMHSKYVSHMPTKFKILLLGFSSKKIGLFDHPEPCGQNYYSAKSYTVTTLNCVLQNHATYKINALN